jgi:mannose-6-phosphate isomerase-like protein (cupin superfamily)
MTVTKVRLSQKLSLFQDLWSPKIVGEVNDCCVKLVKLKGEFVWHHHEEEDELFLVIAGRLTIHLRDGEVVLEPGEFVVIPKGVEHKPAADEEAHILLLEPKSTLNTGNVVNERTVAALERI